MPMDSSNSLHNSQCEPCQGNAERLTPAQIKPLLAELEKDWLADTNSMHISRAFSVKGFAKAVQLANVIAWLGDREGHHPDITFGWGYCIVKFTTHDIKGLSVNDFICAAKVDQLIGKTPK